MIAAILGFIPAVDRRLNIAMRSGTAANVVPRPAKKPTISDRRSVGTRRLETSCGAQSPQPAQATAPNTIRASAGFAAIILAHDSARRRETDMTHIQIGMTVARRRWQKTCRADWTRADRTTAQIRDAL